MQKRWQISEPLTEEQLVHKNKIIEEIKCPELIAEMLIRRETIDIERIKSFFNPNLDDVHDPFIFPDMEKAVNRIIEAIQNKELITIYGDYDVDGTTSTSMLYLGLKKIGANIDFYIPHRMIDGYGLSLSGVDQIKENGTELIISVDCGINAIEEVDQINALDIDIIVTDHHNPKEILPKAYAIINPKMEESGYPFKELAGVGVAYKLLVAVYTKLNLDTSDLIDKYVDLVALGTIADIVPLVGENRIFASIGLKRLIEKHNIGLNALINIAGLSHKELNSSDIVFGIAPRINAAGRMGSALRAVELMVSVDEEESEELAQIIERENSIRQQIDQRTFQEACDIIEKKYKNMDENSLIVVSSDGWHPGVIGIVASKLVEKYYKPTIMISFKDGVGSGSGRSISGFNLFDALQSVEGYLETFGGHKYAAGLSVLMEYLDILENKLSKYVNENVTPDQLIPPLKIESSLELYEINENLLEWMNKFAPFGPGNMRPTFFTERVMIIGFPYNVGKNHLKLKVMKDGCTLDLIGFNLGDFLPFLKKGSLVDIAYSLEFNTWQGRTTIQGKLKDIKFVE
ncbi:MAG: single-stranded-DNA-specific exonuclease RecJ [Candidatus Cloacimonetes bacterium]|nr:single-stranded-DNA-specific exonuclease RecJ [Candidatus Cloacimonadota bacterium]MCF7813169.1 single-stranded-DNA-specific exonuclease RecJ [Candidatus Cloacimonadota bacterium]MCF7867617.1 single-stranded-DNA-specific exonuclease RecJ [Candidatus Cloacimonadota bacterium]MCF7883108.1 single-stranded-DNA-specific exonuclease RecJ [Candidatus Cloacimonadota bacterium]